MPNSVKGERIEPTLPLCVAESLVVNPFEELEGKKFWLPRGRHIIHKTRTANSESFQKL
jgi:hypothetical protein